VTGRRKWTIAGVVLAAAGIVLGVVSVQEQEAAAHAAGQQLFAQLSTDNAPKALADLSRSPLPVRRAFLEQALGSDAAAEQFLRHQHAQSVALSRVDFADVRRLYEDVLRKRLLDEAPSNVMEAATVLLARWNLILEVSAADVGRIAGRMIQRMEQDAGNGALERFSPVIQALAPRVAAESADPLIRRAFSIAIRSDSGNAYDAVAAVTALAPRASIACRRDLALALVRKLAGETRRQPVTALAPMLAPLVADADPREASEIATQITNRILNEWDSRVVDAFLPALRSVAAKTAPPDAENDAQLILRHVEIEIQPAVLLSLTQALNCFGDRVRPEIHQQAAESLLKRIRVERDEAALSAITSSLGVLNHKATPAQFSEAAINIVSRFSSAKDMMADAALSGAIDSVADDLQPAVAARLASLLVDKMIEERGIGPLQFIAAGMADMADEVGEADANRLTGRLLTRLRGEKNPYALRTLAFSIAAFLHATANANDAAAVLAARIADEDDPDDVRKLASGLYALRGKADAEYFDHAAAAITQQITTRVRTDEIAELTVSLHGMAAKAGAEPFEQAATAIVANPSQIGVLEPSLARIAPKVRAPKAQELAEALAARIAQEQNPAKLRALANALGDFPGAHVNIDAGKLLSIPDAPCQLAPGSATLLNPLCSEASWFGIAADVLHATPPARDSVEPDFAQLSDDDDDDAPSAASSSEEPAVDFHKLSDALTGTRPAVPGKRTVPWAAIALLAGGATALLASVIKR
jgi:hypothetical protein